MRAHLNYKLYLLTSRLSISAKCRKMAPALLILAAGQALGQPAGAVTVAPSQLQFSTAQLGSVSAPDVVTVTNNSAKPVSGLSISVSGDFSDKTTCRASLKAGASCQASVTFAPIAPGLRYGSLTVTYTGQPAPAVVNLSGSAYALVSIAIAPQTASIPIGAGRQFHALGSYSDGSIQDISASVTWTSSDTTKLTVANSGVAAGIAAGSARITATSQAVTASVNVNVTTATLVSMAADTIHLSLPQRYVEQFNAVGAYSDGTQLVLTDQVAWTSSTPSVASVSTTGLVGTLGPGSALITAALGSVRSSANLIVTGVTLQSIALSPASVSMAGGTILQMQATGTYSDGSTRSLTNLASWSSLSTNIATVSAIGRISSGGQPGSATISASFAGLTASTAATVNSASLKRITISPSGPSLPVAASQTFTATGTFSDGFSQDVSLLVHWMSSAAAVATVANTLQSEGLANALAPGRATITASFASTTGSATLTITPGLISISVTPADPTLLTGSNQQFAATGTYSDSSTQNLTNQVTWSAAPASIATIGPSGLAQALAFGQAAITAILGTISSSTVLTVSIPAPMLVSLAVSPLAPTIEVGGSQQFYATGTYSDSSTQDLTSTAAWTSFSPAVATIGSSGLATALTVGTTTISASLGAINAPTTPFSVVAALPPPSVPPFCEQSVTGLPPLPSSVTLPALPQSCTVPVYPTPSGAPIVVNTAAALQDALTNAQCGQWIQVQAGVTYQGAFVVPGLACAAGSPVLVENSAVRATVTCTAGSAFPCSSSTVGQTIQVFPQWTVPSQSLAGTSYVPTLESTDTNSPLFVSDGAANWYFAGIEVTLAPTATNIYPIVAMGENTTSIAALPHNITFDRFLVHPAPCPADSITAPCHYVARGVDLNAVNGALMFSNVYGIVNAGQDAAAVLVNNSPGPGLVLGDLLQATGMSIMFNTECTLNDGGTSSTGQPLAARGRSQCFFRRRDDGKLPDFCRKCGAWQRRITALRRKVRRSPSCRPECLPEPQEQAQNELEKLRASPL